MNVHKRQMWKWGLLILSGLFILQCGGSRPLAEKAIPLGVIPFASGELTAENHYANQKLVEALQSSGSFQVLLLSSTSFLADLDDLTALKDTRVDWILTGKFFEEVEYVDPGKRVPFLAYLPQTGIQLRAEVRLFDVKNNKWKFIEQVNARAGRKGDVQALAFDAAEPSLTIDAKERVLLKQEAYSRLFARIIELLEKNMEIKR